MIRIIFILCCVLISKAQSYSLSTKVFQPTPFISHSGTGKFQSYLAKPILFDPVSKLRIQIEQEERIKLKHRNEAHITIITPPEFEQLNPYVSIHQIDSIAKIHHIETANFKILGLGMSSFKEMKTFYILIQSEPLMELRKSVYSHARKKGFKKRVPIWYPHITIGFTARDLYLSDGIKKTIATKIANINISKK